MYWCARIFEFELHKKKKMFYFAIQMQIMTYKEYSLFFLEVVFNYFNSQSRLFKILRLWSDFRLERFDTE